MNRLLCLVQKWRVALPLFLFTLVFAGCETTGGGNGTRRNDPPAGEQRLQIRSGDRITIDFADASGGLPQSWPQIVREDGTITLPLNRTVSASGKTKGQLEDDIRKEYVPHLLRRLTVNVKPEDRWYWVRGEVRSPSQFKYTGEVRVMQAIASAGDFTDFADRRDIQITRVNGETIKVDGRKAITNPELDIPVYPGDTVYVNRRF